MNILLVFKHVKVFKATLDKGPMSKVQWNQTFLLVKNFKLVPRLLNEGLGLRWIKLWFNLHGIILEGKSIGLDFFKKSLNKSSCFGKSKCKLRSKVFHFIYLFLLSTIFLYLCCSNYVRMEDMLWIEDIVEITTTTTLILPIIKLTWLVLWIFIRWLLEWVHFQPFQMHEMEVNQKEGIWIYKRSLNRFPFKKKNTKEEGDCGEK